MRFYIAPDDAGFVAFPDDDLWGGPPDGWEQVAQSEYEQRRAVQREVAEQRSTEFLRQARALQVQAAQALLNLGLSAEHAAVLSGVPAADLEPARS